MKAKDLAVLLMQADRGCDDVFFQVNLDGDSYCLEPRGVTRVNGDEIGVLITPAVCFKSRAEVRLETE